ncbi:MAG: sodium:proton symporter [Pseudomonadota bacterium]
MAALTNVMSGLLPWIGAHGTRILPVSLFVGLAWADLAALLRPALAPTVFIMLTMLIMRVDMVAARKHLASPLIPALGLVWTILAMPVLFAGAIWLGSAYLSAGLVLALIFWASAPPLFSTPALAYLLRLDPALALGFLLATVAAHPLVTPFFTGLFTDGATSVSPAQLAQRLLLLVGGAALIAVVTRRIIGVERIHKASTSFDGLNVIAMAIFAIAIMDGIGARLLADPVYALGFIAFVMALSLASIALTTALFWKAGRRVAATLGFSAGGRNIALVIGALGASVPDDTWLFFAVLQFPIYCLPALLKPVYERILPARP